MVYLAIRFGDIRRKPYVKHERQGMILVLERGWSHDQRLAGGPWVLVFMTGLDNLKVDW